MATPISKVTDYLGFTRSWEKEPVKPSEGGTFDPEKAGPRETLFEWDTVTKPQLTSSLPKLNRSYLIIAIFLSFLLVLMQEFLLIVVIGSMVFLWYALSSAPAEKIHHKITTHGVEYGEQSYGWEELKQFFFRTFGNMDSMCIDTKAKIPGRIVFIVNPGDRAKLQEVVGRYLLFLEEEPTSFVDTAFKSAANKIVSPPEA